MIAGLNNSDESADSHQLVKKIPTESAAKQQNLIALWYNEGARNTTCVINNIRSTQEKYLINDDHESNGSDQQNRSLV